MPSEPVKCHLVTHMDGCRHLIPNLSPMTISGYEAIGSSVVAHMAIPATDYAALTARATAAEQRVRALEEALTPSGDTKAAYIGEFKFTIEVEEPDEVGEMNTVDREIVIPWTTMKEIMAAILARANDTALSRKDTQ